MLGQRGLFSPSRLGQGITTQILSRFPGVPQRLPLAHVLPGQHGGRLRVLGDRLSWRRQEQHRHHRGVWAGQVQAVRGSGTSRESGKAFNWLTHLKKHNLQRLKNKSLPAGAFNIDAGPSEWLCDWYRYFRSDHWGQSCSSLQVRIGID